MKNTKQNPNKQECDIRDIRLKSIFLGPKSENKKFFLELAQQIINSWAQWRQDLFKDDDIGVSQEDQENPAFIEFQTQLKVLLLDLIKRYESEIPSYSPRYVSHMTSDCTSPAFLGHLLAMLHNPNNISRDASTVALDIEKECIEMMSRMLNFSNHENSCGHFTSGGTMANFEALARALKRQVHWILSESNIITPPTISLQQAAHRGWKSNIENPSHLPSLIELSAKIQQTWNQSWKPKLIISQAAHYSWEKIVSLLGLGSQTMVRVPLNKNASMDTQAFQEILNNELKSGSTILAVVSIAGSTELGSLDDTLSIQNILNELKEKKGIHIWHHVDAAYGGFFSCVPDHLLTQKWSMNFKNGFKFVNSVTLDPHKLAYVPYSAGTILVRDSRDYFLFIPDAPYIDADAQWPGAQTIEGSRSATGSTSFWLSAKTLGLNENGYGRLLLLTLKQKYIFEKRLKEDKRFLILPGCDTNLIGFLIRDTISNHSLKKNNEIIKKLVKESQDGNFQYKLSTTRFDLAKHPWLQHFLKNENVTLDSSSAQVLRLVFMNPFLASKEMTATHTDLIYEKLILKLFESE